MHPWSMSRLMYVWSMSKYTKRGCNQVDGAYELLKEETRGAVVLAHPLGLARLALCLDECY